tara:strand:- start:503 stop:1039 length:537 start_codon:yes stop_codon:yes gene_type:complete
MANNIVTSLAIYQNYFFDKLCVVIPNEYSVVVQELEPKHKKAIFICTNTIFLWQIYYIMYNFPGLLSIIFSLHPIHITFKYLTNKDETRNGTIQESKLILSWLFYNFNENIRFISDSFPLLRIILQITFIYNITDKLENNDKLLQKFVNIYKVSYEYIKQKYLRISVENTDKEPENKD